MKTSTHILSGFAITAAFPAAIAEISNGLPLTWFIALLCSVLPDLLERLRRRLLRCDGEVICDPLKPNARILAQGIIGSAWQAVERGRLFRLRLHPFPAEDANRATDTQIVFNASSSKVEVSITGSRKATAGMPHFRRCWPGTLSPDRREGLILEFHPDPAARKLLIRGWSRSWPHGLPFALLVILTVFMLFGKSTALVAAAVWGGHLLLDQGGMLGLEIMAPFRYAAFPTGWHFWNGRNTTVNVRAAWVAGIVGASFLAHGTAYLPWRPIPAILLLAIAAVFLPTYNSKTIKSKFVRRNLPF